MTPPAGRGVGVVDAKPCARCGALMVRPTRRHNRISRSTWAKRRYCNRACQGRIEVKPGDTFGRWTIGEFVEWTAKGHTRWRCRCVCGGEKVVSAYHLVHGKSRSCGCLAFEYRQEWAYRVAFWRYGAAAKAARKQGNVRDSARES